MKILNERDILGLVSLADAIAVMRSAFAQLSSGAAAVPLRQRLEMPEQQARLLVMPAYLPEEAATGAKLIGLHDGNPARGLPLAHSVVMLMDASTGEPQAVLDGRSITNLRTAAGAALATDLLARRESSSVAIFGAGEQARWQLRGMCAVRRIRRAMIIGRTPQRAFEMAQELSPELGIPINVRNHLDRPVDIICTATSSQQPVFDAAQVHPGTHINGIGSYRRDMAELPAALFARSGVRLVVDHRPSCLAEAGDLAGLDLHPPEIGELVTGRAVGRTDDTEITVYKAVGNAVQDIALAAFAFRRSLPEKT